MNGDITENKYVAYNDLGSSDKIYENNENKEKKIMDIMRYNNIEHEMDQHDNDSIFNESQNIEYGQNTDYGFSHEGKNFLYMTYLYVKYVKIMLTLFEKNIYIIDEVRETFTYMDTEGKIC